VETPIFLGIDQKIALGTAGNLLVVDRLGAADKRSTV